MTMPASGALSLGDTPSVSANRELGKASPYQQTITMNDANLRTLAGVGGSGTSWSMSSLYGKSNIAIAQNLHVYCESTDGSVSFSFNDNGTMYYYDPAQSTGDPNWATPNASGLGLKYWVKITRISGVYTRGMTSGTIYPIFTPPYYPAEAYYYVGVDQYKASTGTVDIYSDASGTSRVGGGTYSMSILNYGPSV